MEASLVCVPADSMAMVRSLGGNSTMADTRARMHARQAMHELQSEYFDRQMRDDDDELAYRDRVCLLGAGPGAERAC